METNDGAEKEGSRHFQEAGELKKMGLVLIEWVKMSYKTHRTRSTSMFCA
jgi:hypothetical protein